MDEPVLSARERELLEIEREERRQQGRDNENGATESELRDGKSKKEKKSHHKRHKHKDRRREGTRAGIEKGEDQSQDQGREIVNVEEVNEIAEIGK